ncbi:MAG: ABC transporter permease subunit [Candidatus Latescibacteria bacterium]|nr:ABC transporter permease subunit [Candidatus Latescibacterota bacterium]NIO27292.1 ABC transporter permease subunit [Candidatus Latescibacterota bacterium]NIO54816.1 ABC transporter permease subunit [Candidatus Latescibacterota bacterium]NIT00899.1 ABC transporter permease subunit [Candidatus Latescibacterota bacterium]NIT37822.1 ABC transporter permease subunit [Candidatus Latescibacterota bacterium]
MRRLISKRNGMIGFFLVLLVLIAGIFAPYIAPYDPYDIDMDVALSPPTFAHPLGTDFFGRDVLSRLLVGARISLQVSVLARLIAVALGALLGLCAGYFGGRVDHIVMRLADVTLAYPGLLLLIAVMAAVGPSLTSLIIALGAVGWAGVARLVRAQVLSLKEREFVLAIRSIGGSPLNIMFRHLLPNCSSQLIVIFSMGLGMAVMAESSMSFLGLGAQPPLPSWGSMISSGLDYLRVAPWLSLAPGVAITLEVLGFNLLGDALRDVLDPKLSGSGGRL